MMRRTQLDHRDCTDSEWVFIRSVVCTPGSVVAGDRRVLPLHCSLGLGELHRFRPLARSPSVARDEPLLHLQAGAVQRSLSMRTIISRPFIQLSTFSHQQFWHIACNMIALVSFGRFAYVAAGFPSHVESTRQRAVPCLLSLCRRLLLLHVLYVQIPREGDDDRLSGCIGRCVCGDGVRHQGVSRAVGVAALPSLYPTLWK